MTPYPVNSDRIADEALHTSLVSQWTSHLFHASQNIALNEYARFAIQKLSEVIGFKAGAWLTVRNKKIESFHTSPTLNISGSSLASLIRLSKFGLFERDGFPAYFTGISNLQVIEESMLSESPVRSVLQHQLISDFRIGDTLLYTTRLHNSRSYNLVVLFRDVMNPHYSNEELIIMRALGPVIAELYKFRLGQIAQDITRRKSHIAIGSTNHTILWCDNEFSSYTGKSTGERVMSLNSERGEELFHSDSSLEYIRKGNQNFYYINTGLKELTARENQIANLVREGLTDRDISTQLNISQSTVSNTIRKIFGKLGINSRHQLILKAMENHF